MHCASASKEFCTTCPTVPKVAHKVFHIPGKIYVYK